MTFKIIDGRSLQEVKNFLFFYLSDFFEIEAWNEKNLKSVRKVILQESLDLAYRFFADVPFFPYDSEIIRRLFMKDYETFLKVVKDKFGNVFNLMKEKFKIAVDDTEKLLKVSSDRKLIFEEYERNQQKGNILFKIWRKLRSGDFSFVYLINEETGLNLDEMELKKFKKQENFSEFYDLISQNLVKAETFKLFEDNFYEIFENRLDAEFIKIWKIFVGEMNKEEIEKILQQKDKNSNGQNILHKIVWTKNSNPELLETLLKVLKIIQIKEESKN